MNVDPGRQHVSGLCLTPRLRIPQSECLRSLTPGLAVALLNNQFPRWQPPRALQRKKRMRGGQRRTGLLLSLREAGLWPAGKGQGQTSSRSSRGSPTWREQHTPARPR